MVEKADASVTRWVALLKAGQTDAARAIWEQFFTRMVNLARARLRATGVDEEAVAASAFNSFCAAAMGGRFPRLNDRQDLWSLLVFITGRKAVNHLRRRQARRRGGAARFEEAAALEHVAGREPTPEFAAMVAEEFQRLLARLGDPTLRSIAVWKMEGCTSDEIAGRLGCAVRTVGYKLDLIREVLREAAPP